jgi:copper homeostasis protein
VLNTHRSGDARDVVGRVIAARLEAGRGIATLQFSSAADVEPLWQRIADGTLRSISVGYRVHRYEPIADPIAATVHRAFDMTADPGGALEALIRCGVARVLTSGQRPRGIDGAALLARLVQQAAGRIIILGCGDLDEATIGEVRRTANLSELHFSAPATIPSAMRHRNPALAMGGDDPDREYRHTITDPARVRAVIAAARR